MTDPHRGWEPTTDGRLNRHLTRMGVRQPAQRDAMATMQIRILRDLLRIVEAALIDEQVPADTVRGVLDRIMYGGCPQQADMEVREMDTRLRRLDLQGRTPDQIIDMFSTGKVTNP